MPNPLVRHFWHWWNTLKSWSLTERLIVSVTLLAALVPLIVAGRDGGWLAGVLALPAFVALNVVVYRHGGWGLLGPHFYYDVVRLARRGRSTLLRIAYIVALFIGLALVVEKGTVDRNTMARASERFAYTLFMIQNIAVMILTPAYLASAIAEEKERKTLDLLFTTQLNDTQIILGKLTSRLIHLIGLVLAGFPIVALIQFWGGIDMLLIAGNLANTILNIVSVGSFCLLVSVLCGTVTRAVMICYGLILPAGSCCLVTLRGFPFILQDARTGGGGQVTVQDLGVLSVIHLVVTAFSLGLAIIALRDHAPLGLGPPILPPMPIRPRSRASATTMPTELATAIQAETSAQAPDGDAEERYPRPRLEPETADLFAVPYQLPPVTDHALLWKERYVGGPPVFSSPIVLVPMLPFMTTGVVVMTTWFLATIFTNREGLQKFFGLWGEILRFFYYVFLGAYVIGVAFRAAGSVVRERQQQTLEPLLLLPIDRSEILWAKLIGCVWRGWPWLALLFGDVALGVLIGAFHPFSGVLLCLMPWAIISFFAGLGLMLSVVMKTVLRADLVLLIVAILLIAVTFYMPIGVSPLTYLEPFTFSIMYDRETQVLWIYPGLIAAFYLLAALVFVKTAFGLFSDRTRSTEA